MKSKNQYLGTPLGNSVYATQQSAPPVAALTSSAPGKTDGSATY